MSTSSHEVSLPANCSLVVKEDHSYLLGFRRLHLPLKAVNGVKVLLFSKTSLYLLVAKVLSVSVMALEGVSVLCLPFTSYSP